MTQRHYVSTGVKGIDITPGKRYPAERVTSNLWKIRDDVEFEISILLDNCSHLKGGSWTLHTETDVESL